MTLTIPPNHASDAQFQDLWIGCVSEAPRIAHGTARDVYRIPGHDDKVLKVCVLPCNQANWIESVVYHSTERYKSALAKVHCISQSGRFLVMERLITDVTAAELARVNLPFVNDKKPANFGRDSDGMIKMLDYGMLTLDTEVEGSLFC